MLLEQKQPTARIAVKKNVLKLYSVNKQDVNYLPKDAEFEIELYNPLQETILAKISLNNKEISNGGIILRPGQRIFLERYLNEDRKFKFDVYSVEDTEESKLAISNNGLVSVSFYKEADTIKDNQYNVYSYQERDYNHWRDFPYISPSVLNPDLRVRGGSFGDPLNATITCSASIETGIISKGDKSNQSLKNVILNFKHLPFLTTNVKLLPDSQQPFSTEDLKYRKYCSNCGSKISKGDKYCSECGIKL